MIAPTEAAVHCSKPSRQARAGRQGSECSARAHARAIEHPVIDGRAEIEPFGRRRPRRHECVPAECGEADASVTYMRPSLCTHARSHARVRACVRAWARVHAARACMRIHTYGCMHIWMHARWMRISAHARTHAGAHARTHARRTARAHAGAHARTHAGACGAENEGALCMWPVRPAAARYRSISCSRALQSAPSHSRKISLRT